MLHFILRFLLRIVFWVYYRKMTFQGLDHVPLKGPVILACNHPNSFLDALVVGVFQKRRMHFLARSDVFNTPLKNWILTQLSLLPIYRLQEGMENLDKNKDTFARCHELLDKDGMILIFSEGLCIQELRLRPLKKGTARIALEYTKSGKSLTIVPVGLNYLKPMVPRQELLISASTPFQANQFSAEYATNSGRAINEFNKVLEERLKEVVINVRDREHEEQLAQVLEVKRNEGTGLNDLISWTQHAHLASTSRPDEYAELVQKAEEYRGQLLQSGLWDSAIRESREGSLLIPLLSPIYLAGFLLNGLPWATALYLARTKVRKREFYDSVLLGAFMFLNVFHQLFIFLILLFIHPLLAVLATGILLTTAAISTSMYDMLQANRLLLIKRRLPREKVAALEELRREIIRLSSGL